MSRRVELQDKKPFVVSAKDVADGAVWVCRCGLSTKWPLCDDSHERTRDEEEGVAYEYARDPETGELTRRPVGKARGTRVRTLEG